MKSPTAATLMFWFISLGGIGLLLPWVQHASAGLTLNAPELANWSIRHGEEFRGSLVMLTSFLLRGQLLILAAIVSSNVHRSRWFIIVLLCIALLPPPDGFIRELGNPGYRQLMGLALAAALISAVGSRLKKPLVAYWQLGWSCIGLLSCLYVALRIDVLYDSLQLDANAGPGMLCLVLAYALILMTGLLHWRGRKAHPL